MKPETLKLLLMALALGEGATDDQVLAGVKTLEKSAKDAKEMCTALGAQLAEANGKVAALEAKVADGAKVSFAADVKTTLDTACAEGKITPAQRAGFEAMCATPEQFATFKTSVLPALTVIAPPAPKPPNTPPKTGTALSLQLTDAVRLSLKQSGLSEEAIEQAVAYREKQREAASLKSRLED